MAWRSLETRRVPEIEPVRPPEGAVFGVKVLASGSSGNASLVYVPGPAPGRPSWLGMIDAGISPARVRKLLAADGLDMLRIDDVIYTHLDRDHAQLTWSKLRACRAVRRIHRRHVSRAERDGHAFRRIETYDDPFDVSTGIRVRSVLSAHDQLGVAVLRLEFETAAGNASLGFATDVGSIENAWLDLLRGVDILAIESNYCPQLQLASPRPPALKRRIMGGAGHLSNAESAEAVESIDPAQSIVLLHRSQQCNDARRVFEAHARRADRLTLSDQAEPTPWLWATSTPARAARPASAPRRPATLFDHLPIG